MLQPSLATGLLFRGLTRSSFCRHAKAASWCAPAETRRQVLSRQAHQISRSAQYQYVIRQRKEFVRLLVNDKQYVKVFLRTLPPEARANLFEELKHLKQREAEGKLRQMDMADVPEPTREQFVKIFIRAGAPFVVFGFIDNSLMIIAGETLDITLGAVLGITTMTAAATGNMISDVIGTGFGGMIQALADKFRIPNPNLTRAQQELKSVQRLKNVSSVVGIAVGCILGMWPILLYGG